VLILNFIFGDEVFSGKSEASGLQGAGAGHQDCVFEMSDEFIRLLEQDGVGVEELVLETLLDSDFGGDLVFEAPLREAKDGVLGEHVVEEGPGGLGLEDVIAVDVSFVDGGAQLAL